MNFRSSVSIVSTYCFLIALFGYILISEVLLPLAIRDVQLLKVLLAFLATIGIYPLIFQLFFSIYSRYLYKKVDRRLDIGGQWFQVFVIKGSTNPLDAIRHGICTIDATIDQISIAGQNHRVDQAKTFSSNWQSEATSLFGRRLAVLYVSEGVSRPAEASIARGTMVYQLLGNPPTQMSGNWSDVTPATHSGTITLFRGKAEYERHLADIVRSFGTS